MKYNIEAAKYLSNRIGSCGNSCQNWIVSPVRISLDAPVEAQGCHQEDHRNPEQPSEPGLVGEKHVHQPL